MDYNPTIEDEIIIEEAEMGTLKSNIPGLIAKKEWDANTWRGKCLLAGLSVDTANRIYEGETNLTTATLYKVATILEIKRKDAFGLLVEIAKK